MDIKLQTKVTDNNRADFYQVAYYQQLDAKDQLINLEQFSSDCVLVDCCGWYYRDLFPDNNVIILETVKTALQFKLDLTKFNKLVDDRQDHQLSWPPVTTTRPVLIFDRSPMLKYRDIPNLVNVLSAAVEKYQADQLIVNLNTAFIDDPRLVDRFYNLSSFCIDNFVVKEFFYSTNDTKLFIHFKRTCVI